MSNVKFKDLLTIYRSAQFSQDGVTAHLEITTQEQLTALELCFSSDDNLIAANIAIEDGDPDNLRIGQHIRLKIGPPSPSLGYIAKNISKLVETQNLAFEEPKRYFLIEERFAKGDEQVPETVLRYQKILSFVELLKLCTAYVDKSSGSLVFLHNGKFVIPVKYKWHQVTKINLEIIDKLTSFFTEDTHKEQKISILTNTVISLVQISSSVRRFSTLLTEIQDLYNKFSEGYKIFIADFSYDKIRNEFEEFRVEYAGKIHKVFSDIQNQLLAIPVATIIAATSMKSATNDFSVLINKAVLAGSWVFSILFALLCINQWKTLDGLNRDIVRRENLMIEDYPTIKPSFEDIFEWLHKRVRLQFAFLISVVIILAVGLISAHYFYFKMIEVGAIEKQEIISKNAITSPQSPKH